MLQKIKIKKGFGLEAISQIALIVLSIFAFAYILGQGIPVVSAQQASGGACVFGDGPSDVISIPPGLKGDRQAIDNWCFDKANSKYCICANELCSGNSQLKITDCPVASPRSSTVNPTQPAPSLGPLEEFLFRDGDGEQNQQNRSQQNRSDGGGFLASTILGELKLGTLLTNALIAAGIYAGTRFFLGLFGADPELANSAGLAAAGGFFVGKTVANIFGLGAGLGLGIGLGVGIIIFFATFKQTRYDLYEYSCFPWDAPLGGKDCERCNVEDLTCTEYMCRSLGQACELINQGTSEELCVWVNRGDVNPPVIQPWEEALTVGYRYIPDSAISPPDRGVKIVPQSGQGCVAPFTPLKFGIELDEPAKCKLDTVQKNSFDEMNFFFGGSSTSKYNHSQQFSLPSPDALASENITLENGGNFALYARCQDSNGNSNVANFVFSFCTDEGPDTTPPFIVSTSILNNFPIAFNQSSVALDVFVNEPSECRWSRLDQAYDDMENQMSCATGVFEFNAQGLYKCSTTLTGLNDRVNNDFYFRCKDQPHLEGTEDESMRNVDATSCIFAEDESQCKFTLVGTQPLVIDSTEPNGTIRDSTDVIRVYLEVVTSAGYDRGAAICAFSDTGTDGSYIDFFNTGTQEHSQRLDLPEGSYQYFVRCTDLGGNTDEATVSFSVETDTLSPIVVRVFREDNSLKVITDEEGSCVYDTISCSYDFDEGIRMSTVDNRKHSVTWNPSNNFYIKCADEFGNQPSPNACSIVARPFEIRN